MKNLKFSNKFRWYPDIIHITSFQSGKDHAETNPNEQRLPLKKRHYHLTSASSQQLPGPSEEIQSPSKSFNSVEKQSSKELTNHQRKEHSDKSKNMEVQRILRSSIDEAIEATITRYTSESPALVSDTNSDSSNTQIEIISNQRSVIVTPKKRHRIEDLMSKSISQNDAKGLLKHGESRALSQSPSGKSFPTSFRSIANSANKTESIVQNVNKTIIFAGREGVIKSTGNIEPKRRLGSRSSSLNNKDLKIDKVAVKSESKIMDSMKNDESPKATEKAKRSGKVESKPDEKSKIDLKWIDKHVPSSKGCERLTRSSVKPEPEGNESAAENEDESPAVSKSIQMTEEELMSKFSKQPSTGIFEPSAKSVEIDCSLLAPLTFSSDVKLLRKAKELELSKRKKLLNLKACKLKIKPQRLATGDISLMKAAMEVKKKARRRKAINRTGFPTNRKRKKKPIPSTEIIENKTADSVITTPDKSRPAERQAKESPGRKREKQLPEKVRTDLNSNSTAPSTVSKDAVKGENPPEEGKAEERPRKRIRRTVEAEIAAKRARVDRESRLKKEDAENKEKVSGAEGRNVVRKRKRLSTVKNTDTNMRDRCQFPLLSMKKFKRVKEDKEESRAPR